MMSKTSTCNNAWRISLFHDDGGWTMRICLLCGWVLGAMLPLPAQAAEIRVIAATPLTAVVQELGSQFSQTSGHKLVSKYVSGPTVKEEIDSGGSFDLALSITPVIEALIAEGKLVAGTRADLAYAVVGVGVRAGAPKPDISTVEHLRRALLNAKSIAHSATGASGEHFKNMIARLGITDELKPKLQPMPADRIAQAVPNGEAEMIVVTMSVIMAPGMEVVGPLPAELQFYNKFAGAIAADARQRDAAAALLQFFASPSAAPVIKAKGLYPGVPQ